MICKFEVGQRVVCVNDTFGAFSEPSCLWNRVGNLGGLTKGEVYTIRRVGIDYITDLPVVWLVEIVRPLIADDIYERGMDHRRFAPLEEKKTDISIFTQMLVIKKVKEDA